MINPKDRIQQYILTRVPCLVGEVASEDRGRGLEATSQGGRTCPG